MNHSFRPVWMIPCACLLVLGASALRTVHAQTVTILHSFGNASALQDGQSPNAALVQGSDGNFYGTTAYGGSTASFSNAGSGTVFKITPSGAETVLHSFQDGSASNDGADPSAALVQGTDGNFYGTTLHGGSTGTPGNPYSGSGTVFKITPSGTYTVLHSFGDGTVLNDGLFPNGLIQARDGNFYGTTQTNGSPGNFGNGVVFKITSSGAVTILYRFGDGSDGANPFAALVQGTDGNFYGTTSAGGSSSNGTVFKITPSGTETVLHSFFDGSIPNDGGTPLAALIQGTDGDFYGTTDGGGGLASDGTAFKITPSGTETVLHGFGDGTVANDGQEPQTALVQGTDGNFYGTTVSGGNAAQDAGTIFEMTSTGRETVLHRFNDGTVPFDGFYPAALTQGTDGNFYGTTGSGGTTRYDGTVFKLDPSDLVPAPTITSFAPASGPAGSSMIIIGNNFQAVNTVRFHDANTTNFYVNLDGTQLRIVVPVGAMKGTITVTSPGGSATTATPFRVTYYPVIASFSPTPGPIGTVVTITGTHLTGITRVRFHEADATVYSSNAAGTQLTVTVPPGAQTGTITLDNRDALAATSSQVFTVTP